jgi:hypothetical protein
LELKPTIFLAEMKSRLHDDDNKNIQVGIKAKNFKLFSVGVFQV